MKANSRQNRTRLIDILTSNGWARDQWGHYKKELQVRSRSTGNLSMVLHRVKMKTMSCRLERQINILGQNEWVVISHSYYKALKFPDDGRLIIGHSILGKPRPSTSEVSPAPTTLDSFMKRL